VKTRSLVSEGKTLKIAFFDCFSGISGDMCLGALADAGLPLSEIEKGLRRLPLRGYRLTEKKIRYEGIAATKVDVVQNPKARSKRTEVRKWSDIRDIIKFSRLPENIKKKGTAVFRTLFDAESKVHGEPLHKVHLHELGGTDCIIDVFGTLIGLDLLGIRKVYASPVNVGGGAVSAAHCILPVPAPATAEILRGVPVYSSGVPYELATPTGAAILKTVSTEIGVMPLFVTDKIGIGAGSREIRGRPNILRIFIGDSYKKTAEDRISVIETNIDDMNPQIYEYLIERLFAEGALDAYLTQIMMKKTRPGIKLSVLCHESRRNDLAKLILEETTTIGIRYHEVHRIALDRSERNLQTRYGRLKIKESNYKGSFEKITPEYDDCKKLAKKKGVPLLKVIEEAKRSSRK
jgi:uncharacterized protein (TIGR00299 family) protein